MGASKLTILQESRGEGTYPICGKCSSNADCCSRIVRGGSVDLPVLLPQDVANIERYANVASSAFSVPANEAGVRRMLNGETGCYFYRHGKCVVYDARPIDCRLFPFDIIEKPDGRLVWIAYMSICPTQYDPTDYFDKVRRLLPRLSEHLRTFARIRVPGMLRLKTLELGDVDSMQGSLEPRDASA